MAVRWDNRCARCDKPSTRSVCKPCAKSLAARAATSAGRQLAALREPDIRRFGSRASVAPDVLPADGATSGALIAGRGCPPPSVGGASFSPTRVHRGVSLSDTPSSLMPDSDTPLSRGRT